MPQHESLFVTDAVDPAPMIEEEENLSQVIEEGFGRFFLKLENYYLGAHSVGGFVKNFTGSYVCLYVSGRDLTFTLMTSVDI